MRYTRCLFLFSLLLLGGIFLLNGTSQDVFAAHHNVKMHKTLFEQDPNNYVQGYMNGYQSGYEQGLDNCTLQNIHNSPSVAFDYSSQMSPTRYEIGETKGYGNGFSKGEEDCHAQLQTNQPQPVPIPPSPPDPLPFPSASSWF